MLLLICTNNKINTLAIKYSCKDITFSIPFTQTHIFAIIF